MEKSGFAKDFDEFDEFVVFGEFGREGELCGEALDALGENLDNADMGKNGGVGESDVHVESGGLFS